MNDQSSKSLPVLILFGVLSGGALGYLLPDLFISLGVIGRLYLNALTLLILPLIATSAIVGVSSFGSLSKIRRTALSTMYYFGATSAIAAVIALVVGKLILPTSAASFYSSETTSISIQASHTLSAAIQALIPSNLVGNVLSGQFLGAVIVLFLVGAVLAAIGRRGRQFTELFRVLQEIVQKLTRALLYAAPVGLFFLVGSATASGTAISGNFFQTQGSLLLAILVALGIQAFLIIPLALKMLAQRNIFEFAGHMLPALGNALGTGSSTATLPVTTDCMVNGAKVDERASSLVLPSGAVLNLDGGVILLTISALFLSAVSGYQLSILQLLAVVGLSLLMSIGTAGIPGAGMAAVVGLLALIGVNPNPVALAGLVAFGWLYDRLRATMNVWSDAVGSAVVAETFEFKTARRVSTRRIERSPVRSSRSSPRRPTGGRYERTPSRTGSPGSQSRERSTFRSESRTGSGGRSPRPESTPPRRERMPRRPAEKTESSPFEVKTSPSPMFDIQSPPPLPETGPAKTRSVDDSSTTESTTRQYRAPRRNGPPRRTRSQDSPRDDNNHMRRRSPNGEQSADRTDNKKADLFESTTPTGSVAPIESPAPDLIKNVVGLSKNTAIEVGESLSTPKEIDTKPDHDLPSIETGDSPVTETERQPSSTFGRQPKSRRPEPSAEENEKAEQPVTVMAGGGSEEETEDRAVGQYSSDNQQFGRANRKRPAR